MAQASFHCLGLYVSSLENTIFQVIRTVNLSICSNYSFVNLNFCIKLPELNEEFEDDQEPFGEKLKITFIQICGLITGISIMIILNMYEDDFNF